MRHYNSKRNPNNLYNHGFHNTFDYNHFMYSDYLLYTVTASAHIIRYSVFVSCDNHYFNFLSIFLFTYYKKSSFSKNKNKRPV